MTVMFITQSIYGCFPTNSTAPFFSLSLFTNLYECIIEKTCLAIESFLLD